MESDFNWGRTVGLDTQASKAWFADNAVGFRCAEIVEDFPSRGLEIRSTEPATPVKFVNVRRAKLAVTKTEITVAQYRDCIHAGDCEVPRIPEGPWSCNIEHVGRDAHPMNCIEPSQAMQYCESLGARLPAEHEWDSISRSESSPLPWLEDVQGWECSFAWVGYGPEQLGCERFTTAPVASFPKGATKEGVEDLVGNVWELVSTSNGYVRRGAGWDVYLSPSADGELGLEDRMQVSVAYAESTGFRCVR